MKTNSDKFVVVYRTGKLHELEMAKVALQESKIPCYSQEEHLGGLKIAMPITTIPGPGVWWALHVSQGSFDAAKQILEELPIEYQLHPDLWNFGPSERNKKGFKIYAGITLVITIAVILYLFVENLMEAFSSY